MSDVNGMLMSAFILAFVLAVFTIGKSPVFRVDRAGAAIIGAALTVGTGILSFEEASRVVDYRTIVVLFAMMIISANLKLAGFFEMVGAYLLQAVATKKQLLLAVVFTSGVLSAFCINDIVCLLFTPIVLLVCRKAGCHPLPHLLAVATASNIGSAATLIGNPQNIMIASLSGLSFLSYSVLAAPVAALGLILNYVIILAVFKTKLQGSITADSFLSGTYHRYLIVKSLIVTGFVLAGFASGMDMAVVAALGAAYLLITRRLKPNKVYASVDFNLLVMFIGLFVVVGGVEHAGLMTKLIDRLGFVDFGNFTVFTLAGIILSNIFSNVPAVMLLKYFIPAADAGIWWKGMALFTTFAGNLTITGSVANLIVAEIARRQNVEINFRDYLKVGLPLTFAVTAIGLAAFALFL